MSFQKLKIGGHLGEETLEEYAFGRLVEPELGRVEEHLLVCEDCQDALAEIDKYIGLMKAAMAEPAVRVSARRRFSFVAAGSIAAGVAIAALLPRLGPSLPPETVKLVSMRGAEIAHLSANHAADLRIEMPDLPDGEYRVEVVDAAGGPVWSGIAWAVGNQLRVSEPKRLRSGVYWIRLYSASGELLREFGLKSS